MDFSSFSDEHFNVKVWVNSILSVPEASENVEGYASQLVMKLQLFIQEVNNALEDTSQQVLQNLPRVVRDAESVLQEVNLLQAQMKAVRDDVAKVERDTAQSMQALMKIDGIKSRMQIASKALQEADNWTTLSADVDDVFQTGDYHSIAAKLQGMQQSLKILVDIPDYKERCQYLETLKNRLEAMISPSLVTAINAQSIDAAQIYVKIFRDIERLPALQKYYHKCQKEQLLLKWKEIVESDPDYTLLNWMAIYCDYQLSNWHTQMKWFSVVFPDLSAVPILCDILCDSLNSLSPPIAFCVTSALKLQSNAIAFLTDLKQTIERFSRSVSSAIRAHNPGMLVDDGVKRLAKALYLPLVPHVSDYAFHEEKFLLSQLGLLPFQNEDVSEIISILSESVKKVFVFANETNNHCIHFTNGCCYPALVSALNVALTKYLEKVQQAFMHWQESLNLEDSTSRTKNDWSFLQQALHALQICGEILLQTESLEQTLITNFLSCAKTLGYATSLEDKKELNPFCAMDDLLLTSNDANNFRALLKTLNDAPEPTLLRDIKKSEVKLCRNIAKAVFDIFFTEIKQQLLGLSEMKTWTLSNPSGVLNIDLPAFGLSPQEYITQIGQYLMTVPLHIEPFAAQENLALLKGLNYGKFPYANDGDQGDHIADYLLSCIATGTCNMYVEKIMKIPQLTPYAAKQLATDIDYLCNVLDDLGLRPSKNLQAIPPLLKVPMEDYTTASEGGPPQLVSTIQRLRNLSLPKY